MGSNGGHSSIQFDVFHLVCNSDHQLKVNCISHKQSPIDTCNFVCKENLKGENDSCGSRLDRKHGVSLEEVLEVKEGLGFKIEGYRKGSDIGKGKCDSKPRGIVPKFSL